MSSQIERLAASVERLNGVIELKTTDVAARVERVREIVGSQESAIEQINARLAAVDMDQNGGSIKSRIANLEGMAKWIKATAGTLALLIIGGFITFWFRQQEVMRTVNQQHVGPEEMKQIINGVLNDRGLQNKQSTEDVMPPDSVPRRAKAPRGPKGKSQVLEATSRTKDNLAELHTWADAECPPETPGVKN